MSAPDRVREAVVEAACRLFAERGIHAVSVREIAREVGVSHTLLHLYFGTKDEILLQVFKRFDSTFTEELLDTDKLDEAVGDVFRHVVNEPALTRVLVAAMVEGVIPEPVGTKLQGALIEKLGERISDGTDPRVLSVVFSSMALGWAVGSDWLLQEAGIPEGEREEVVEKAAAILGEMVRSHTREPAAR